MLEPVRPEAVLPDRALCLPTFSHFLIVNKASLTHSFSLPRPPSLHTHTNIKGQAAANEGADLAHEQHQLAGARANVFRIIQLNKQD